MTTRHFVLHGCAALALVLVAASAGDARQTMNRTTYLTFSRSVALPGVTLDAGRYIFDIPSPGVAVVRVMSGDGKRLHYLGLTQPERRPSGFQNRSSVIFGETPEGTPPPITVWFPPDASDGRRFLYP